MEVRSHGWGRLWRNLRRRTGAEFVRFYWVKETLPAETPERLTVLPEGFTFSEFGEAEVDLVAKLSQRGAPFTEARVQDAFARGHTCFGLKFQGEIVAFSWFALNESFTMLYPVSLKPNEAYLFNMFVQPAFRGHHLAPILRQRSYEVLRGLGRDTFFSITVVSNEASWRFKQKLGAQRVLLVWYLALAGKFERRWVIRRY